MLFFAARMLRVAHLIASSLAFLFNLQPTDYFLNTKLLINTNKEGKGVLIEKTDKYEKAHYGE